MGQKHKRFREFRTPFPLRDICENPRSNVRTCAAGDGAICCKNRKSVPYHGANPNTRNGARLRSPSLIMAPALMQYISVSFQRGRVTCDESCAIIQTVHLGLIYEAKIQVLSLFSWKPAQPRYVKTKEFVIFRSLN